VIWHICTIYIYGRPCHADFMSQKTSRLRQKLLEASQAFQLEIEHVLAERGPMIRGSFGKRRRVCGKDSCRCARGELHESAFIAASDAGRVRQVHVPAAEERMVAAGVQRYQRFRRLKAKLVGLAQRQVRLTEQIGQSLLTPYPKGRPLPRPKRLLRAAHKPRSGKV
jgi:hypothetical protein